MSLFTEEEHSDLARMRLAKLELVKVLGGDSPEDVPTSARDVEVYIQAMEAVEKSVHRSAALRLRSADDGGGISKEQVAAVLKAINAAPPAIEAVEVNESVYALPTSLESDVSPHELAIGTDYIDPDEIDNIDIDVDSEAKTEDLQSPS